MYESKATLAERRATRSDWTVTTTVDPITSKTLVTVESPAGWGNTGSRDIDVHWDAMKARVRREFRKIYRDVPFTLEVEGSHSYGTGVFYSFTFASKFTPEEKTIGDRSRDGLLEIMDTSTSNEGIHRVTIRETVGGNCLIGGFPESKARALAKATMKGANRTSIVNRFTYHTCQYVTVEVWERGAPHN